MTSSADPPVVGEAGLLFLLLLELMGVHRGAHLVVADML